MPPCFCSFNPPSTSISKFISDPPLLSMLETDCHKIKVLRKNQTGRAQHTVAASIVLAFCATSPARDLDFALSAFSRISKPNLFTWNTIIRGFCHSSDPHVGISLFIEMLAGSTVKPEKLIYPSIFNVYTQLGLAKDGGQLHGRIIELGLDFDPFIRNSIIHMYANCGLLGNARKLFDESHDLDAIVAWISMIMGFAKCANVEESWRLFCKISSRLDISWNTMISGFVRNGRLIEALDLFHGMQGKGIRPSQFTLVSVLNACAKLGDLVQRDKAGKYFKLMQETYGIEPRIEHYGHLVHVLGRAGLIEEAAELPDAVIWESLLSACGNHGNIGNS